MNKGLPATSPLVAEKHYRVEVQKSYVTDRGERALTIFGVAKVGADSELDAELKVRSAINAGDLTSESPCVRWEQTAVAREGRVTFESGSFKVRTKGTTTEIK